MSWKRDGLVIWRPIKALLYADKDAFYWFKNKLGLSEYQMGRLGLGEGPGGGSNRPWRRTSEPLSSHFISGGGRGGVINRINADLVTHIYRGS